MVNKQPYNLANLVFVTERLTVSPALTLHDLQHHINVCHSLFSCFDTGPECTSYESVSIESGQRYTLYIGPA